MKQRKHEKIGGGFTVHRRGKKTGRVASGNLPFEHPTCRAAEEEARRLAEKFPGETFTVWHEVYSTAALVDAAE